ncbi:hypothetical protein ES703_86598 [subsurface metagenome]
MNIILHRAYLREEGQRGVSPFKKQLPPLYQGEGDKGGEVTI